MMPVLLPTVMHPWSLSPLPAPLQELDAAGAAVQVWAEAAEQEWEAVAGDAAAAAVAAVEEGKSMKLAIASGKGGTGKTTVAVSLALTAQDVRSGGVQYLDCDVEEPNGHIFLRPEINSSREFTLEIPEVNEDKCTYCGKCREICRFNAITVLGKTIMAFPDLCHSCGGCFLVCPEDAIESGSRTLGVVETGSSGGVGFVHGRLRVGEAMAPPLIGAVKAEAANAGPDSLVILDAPPGTSCPVIETVKDADYTILVTEPTPFGLNDLQLAVGMLRKLDRPFGVIINRAGLGFDDLEQWCGHEDIDIMLKIPFDRKIAEGYASGTPLVDTIPSLREAFASILEDIERRVS